MITHTMTPERVREVLSDNTNVTVDEYVEVIERVHERRRRARRGRAGR